MSEITYRPAVASELTQVSELVNSAFRGEGSKRGWTTEEHLLDGQRTDPSQLMDIITQPDNFIILAIFVDKVVGSAHLAKKDSEHAYFGMLTVSPELQNKQVGRGLLDFCEKEAVRRWQSRFMLMTVIPHRKELISWYIRRGYSQTGREFEFPVRDPRFGIPKVSDLKLVEFSKALK